MRTLEELTEQDKPFIVQCCDTELKRALEEKE